MQIDLDEVLNLLPPEANNDRILVLTWVEGMTEYLNETYDAAKLERLSSFVLSYVVDAIKRRLAKPDTMLISESAGPFRGQWSERSARGGFFLPEELADLNRVLGKTGTRSYRTQAPQAIVRGW